MTEPTWVTCRHCGLEIPIEGAEEIDVYVGTVTISESKGSDYSEADHSIQYMHPDASCQKPFFRVREIGSLKKPSRIRSKLAALVGR